MYRVPGKGGREAGRTARRLYNNSGGMGPRFRGQQQNKKESIDVLHFEVKESAGPTLEKLVQDQSQEVKNQPTPPPKKLLL